MRLFALCFATGLLLVLILLASADGASVSSCVIDTSRRRLVLGRATQVATVVSECLQLHKQTFPTNSSSVAQYRFLEELVIGAVGCQPSPASGFANFQWQLLEPLMTAFQPWLRVACIDDLVAFREQFANVSTLAGVTFSENRNLVNISGLNSLLEVSGRLEIYSNWKLKEVNGFRGLQRVSGRVKLDRNNELSSIVFPALKRVGGSDILYAEHALQVTYNPKLLSLSGFSTLETIEGGTVRIEGNSLLCLPGYPQWDVDSLRTRSYALTPAAGRARGVDWRTYMDPLTVECRTISWQGSGGVPTLVVRDNAPESACVAEVCSPACATGCWLPADGTACGKAYNASSSLAPGPLCRDPPPLSLPPSPPTTRSAAATTASRAQGNGGGDDAISYWVPPWKMPGILVFVLAMAAALALVSVLCALCVRYVRHRRKSRNLGVEKRSRDYSPRGGAVSPSNGDLRESTISMATFPLGPSSVSHGDRGQLLDNDPTGGGQLLDGFETRVIIASADDDDDNDDDDDDEYGDKSRGDVILGQSLLPGDDPLQSSRWSDDVMTAAAGGFGADGTSGGGLGVLDNFPRDQIDLEGGKVIGQTALWDVKQVMARRLVSGLKRSRVIAMEMKNGVTEEDERAFVEQLKPMRLRHDNVLCLLATCSDSLSHIALCEPCGQGDLKSYLLRHQTTRHAFVERALHVQFSCDLASAMAFLHSQDIVYRDLAAHSCQVTSNLVLKLGDCGLAPTLFPEDYYSIHFSEDEALDVPLRWMSPEQMSMQQSVSPASDGANTLSTPTVHSNSWALGVTLWEILSLGATPFSDLTDGEVWERLLVIATASSETESALHLSDPTHGREDTLSQKIFHCTTRCMAARVDDRPSTGQVLHDLQQMRAAGQQQALVPHLSGAWQRSAAVEDKLISMELTRRPSALKKSSSGQSRAKRRVGFKEGDSLTEVRNIERNSTPPRSPTKRGLKLSPSSSSSAPEYVDPLAQFDHLADLRFDGFADGGDGDGQDSADIMGMFPLVDEGEEIVMTTDPSPLPAAYVTDIDSHLSIATTNYVDTLQRRRRKRRKASELLQRSNGTETSTGARNVAPGSVTNDDVMIW